MASDPQPDADHHDGSDTAHESDSSGKPSGGQQQQDGGQTTPAIEWVVGVVAGLLVLGLLGFVVYEAATAPGGPPAITLRADRIVPTGSGYVVEFTAVNSGGATARALQVHGALHAGTAQVETASATVSWVPAGTERQGGLFFRHDPRRYRLELQPKGYGRP